MNEADRKRFRASFIKSDDGCWRWKKGRSPKGYGVFNIQGHPFRAHRIAFEINKGEIPEGKWILHSCDHPECVNPDHLRIGDHVANVHDKVKRNRQFHPSGEIHPLHKLNKDQVLEIRKRTSTSKHKLATRFGVSEATIRDIWTRRSWKHL